MEALFQIMRKGFLFLIMRIFYTDGILYWLYLIIIFHSLGCVNQNKSVLSDPDASDYVYFYDTYTEGELEEASIYFQKALEDEPCINPEFYIVGTKMYRGLIENARNAKQKEAYRDSIMSLYDKRLSCFENDSINIINRKLIDAYVFYRKNTKKLEWLYSLFNNTYEISGEQFYDANLLPYFDIARRYQVSEGKLSEKNLFDLYDELNSHIDSKMNDGGDREQLQIVLDKLSEMLPTGPQIDCDFILNTLLPKLDPNYWNEKLADNILRLCLNSDVCERVQILRIVDHLQACGYKVQAKRLIESLQESQ